MSRKTGVLVAVLLCAVVTGSVLAATGRISVYVNGQPIRAQAISRGGVIYLPARVVSEALGVPVQYHARSRTVHVGSGAPDIPVAQPRVPSTVTPRRAAAAPSKSRDVVHITNTGSKYHAAGCRYLSRSDTPISRKDAEAQGYTPCGLCKP